MLVITVVQSDLDWRCLLSTFSRLHCRSPKGHFTGRPILPATSYISELKGHLIWVIGSSERWAVASSYAKHGSFVLCTPCQGGQNRGSTLSGGGNLNQHLWDQKFIHKFRHIIVNCQRSMREDSHCFVLVEKLGQRKQVTALLFRLYCNWKKFSSIS